MDFVLLIEKQKELAENMIELLEMSGILAKYVKSTQDIQPYLQDPDLFAIAANSLSLDGHIRTVTQRIKDESRGNVQFILFGENDNSGHEDVVDHYLRMPFDNQHLVEVIHNALARRRSKVA